MALEYFSQFSSYGNPLPQQARKALIFAFNNSYLQPLRCLMSSFALETLDILA